ncbi:MAG: holo-ACP synthase [Candidatus Krumholzibacteriota bacterium]|nr:holo-ACP synthase [Candidatus Krumholzibacteriota bacterium]
MIIGIGIDSVSITRIMNLIDRYGERFLGKIFTEDEIEESSGRHDYAQFFAARFAAREAFFKALGTGWGRGISLKEAGVVKDVHGKPGFSFSGTAAAALEKKGVTVSHLSLTHDGEYAQAFVILEGGV